jgi:hypothetical protein
MCKGLSILQNFEVEFYQGKGTNFHAHMAKLMSIAWQLWEIDIEPSARPVTAHFDLDVELNVWAAPRAAPKTSHLEAEEKSNPS